MSVLIYICAWVFGAFGILCGIYGGFILLYRHSGVFHNKIEAFYDTLPEWEDD